MSTFNKIYSGADGTGRNYQWNKDMIINIHP